MSDEPRKAPTERAPTSAFAPDVVRLREWMHGKLKALAFLDLVTMIIALVARMRDLNTELHRRLVQLTRARPRSERLRCVEAQLKLFEESPPPPPKKSNTEPAEKPARKHGGGRTKKPMEWPRQIVENLVPAEKRICPVCGREMTTVGYQKCEKIELRPAEIYIEERRDERVACTRDNSIVSAPTPAEIVERGVLGTVLITEAACDKFLEQMPIERQARRWLRARVNMSPRTLGRAVCSLADLCLPIAKAIHCETRACDLLATDATGLPVLDPEHPDNIRTGAVWVWIGSGRATTGVPAQQSSDAKWISFVYAPDGDDDHPKSFLGEQRGRVVQCDGTPTLNFVERMGGKRPGCWAHARRRFVAAARAGDQLALEAVRLIARLFAIDAESKESGEDVATRGYRRAVLAPDVLAEIRAWVDAYRGLIPPKTPLGKALGYVHRQWPRLILFLDDGRIELTNNHAERELRRLVLGRKNWLFACKDIGGVRAATMLTILGTCIAQGIRPRQYLHALVKRLLAGWPQSKLRDLLPDRLAIDEPDLRLLPVASTTKPKPLPSSASA
jgi:transposase